MELQVTTTVELKFDSSNQPKVKKVHVHLKLPDQLDESAYYDENERPNAAGVQAITSTLVQGLVANIHGAHQNGARDSAEHLRHIIKSLEEGFVALAKVK